MPLLLPTQLQSLLPFAFHFISREPSSLPIDSLLMTTSFGGAANSVALLKDPKVQIPSFHGLRSASPSASSLSLTRNALSLPSSTPPLSLIRAVSTVCFPFSLLFFPPFNFLFLLYLRTLSNLRNCGSRSKNVFFFQFFLTIRE